MRKSEIYSLVLTLFGVGLASKCPEPRKPHSTSCTIYYNCVNLPGGGYVWAPAKCTNGLVFQPYLRICVLPGDSWTCDILATETPETTTNQFPELIDSTQTSYLGYGDSSKFSDPADYYKVDKYTEPIDSLEQTVTPYPLIEVTQPNNYVNQIDSTIKNLGVPIAIKHSEDNYLYHFINGQEVLSTPVNANNQQLQAHLQRLIDLVERLFAYQGLGLPLDRQLPRPTSPTPLPPNYNNFPDKNKDSALNYLVKNYILKSQAQNQGLKNLMNLNDQEAATTMTTTPAAINLDQEINGPENSNNIIMVKDGLNNRQYFTIAKYKSIAHQLTTETVKVIPCTSGVRHPNSTDCTKYYSCEPGSAKIRQYSCPSNTAFNKYKRLCESHEFLLCMSLGGAEATSRNSPPSIGMARDKESSILSTEAIENPCQTVGKHADPDSERNYYLCFSDNGGTTDLKFQKMTCPNSLIFCQDKNVCTTKNRCDGA